MTFLPLAGRDGHKPRRAIRSALLPSHDHGDEDYETDRRGASFPGSVFNLSTTIVGAGIMALPAAVKVLGLVPGLTLILLAAALTHASIDMILRAGRPPAATSKAVASSYAAVVGDALGVPGRALLHSCIVVNNLGMLVVYMIIIGIPHCLDPHFFSVISRFGLSHSYWECKPLNCTTR
ncbi:amino acid transporter AVT6A-like [Canna indica]|uniref:Amino acid transporter AVT6A-like n=1 Tax=Canna indica TaxID=4628 RepID=A0AAQ3JLQ9_9LILI|nr:amino acid transporter AVT6A-like [Canna indica]